MYRLREAGIEDFPKVAGIHDDPAGSHLHYRQEKLDQVYYEEVIGGKLSKIYLVEKSREPAGFILFRINPEGLSIFIEQLSIQEDYVKKGIDEHLHDKVKRFAERQHMKQLTAIITTVHPVVRTFFDEKDWHPGEQAGMYIRNL